VTTERPEIVVAQLACRRVSRGALIWGGVFALIIVSSVYAFEATYGTPAERATLLRGVGENVGVRALFGPAWAIDTSAGFLAWRTLGLLPLVAGIWGLLVATRLLRGEEESGRWAMIICAPIRRSRATLATLVGIGSACLVLFSVSAVTLLAVAAAGTIPAGEGLWLALALCIAAPAFASVGALTAQLAATRREAAALAGVIFTLAFVVRAAADGSSAARLRWATPLGWIEEMRPLTGARPAALLPLLVWTAAFTAAAVWISGRRDEGASLIAHSDERTPRHILISSACAFSLRESLNGLIGWGVGLALTAFLFGALSSSIARLARESAGLREHIEGTTRARIDISSAHGYLAIVFIFFAVALALYAETHLAAARDEEASGRLDTLLSKPLGRRRWLAGRLIVAAGSCVTLAAVTALAAWAGGVIVGASVGMVGMAQAAVNTLPVVALFMCVGALAFAVVPRHTSAAGFGAVTLAYLWEQTGALVNAPEAVLAVSPFHWLALAPSQPIDRLASLTMLAIAAVLLAVAFEWFRRRDLVTA
jgi:ABC-2 type transport system permease protein